MEICTRCYLERKITVLLKFKLKRRKRYIQRQNFQFIKTETVISLISFIKNTVKLFLTWYLQIHPIPKSIKGAFIQSKSSWPELILGKINNFRDRSKCLRKNITKIIYLIKKSLTRSLGIAVHLIVIFLF